MKKSRLNWVLTCLLVLLVQVGFAQSKALTGVVSEDGLPLPGVSVILQGTQTGTQTDLDGKYSIQVKAGDVLVFSFIGMKDVSYKVGTTSIHNVNMTAEGSQLEEVVVTAMGIKRSAKALGYATQELKTEDINKTENSSLSGALQGKLAGVQITPSSGAPGASSQIVIRGARSFTGNNTPLYVIDGMPVESTAPFSTGNSTSGADIANRGVDIDPSDILSINVLKGQAASALYGIRASNGVIVITTKSGKGIAEGKTVVSFTTTSSFESLSKKPNLQKTYAQGSGGVFDPTSSMSWGPKISELPNDSKYGGNVANDLNGGHLRPGYYYVPQRLEAGLDPWVKPGVYDNIDAYFRTGHTLSNNLNISKNAGGTNYSFGIGNTTQEGMMPGTDMTRTNIKLAAETKLNSEWTTGFSGNYVNSKINKASSANDSTLPGIWGAPVSYDQGGIPYATPSNPYDQTHFRIGSFNNPYWAAEHNEFSESNSRFFGNAFVAFSPEISQDGSKNLTIRYQGGVDNYTTHYRDVYEFGTAHDLTVNNKAKISLYGTTSTVYNSLFTVNYDMYLGEDLRLDVMVGNEFNESTAKGYSDYGSVFNFGGWPTIANAVNVSSTESRRRTRTVGFFSNIGLSFKDMLFLNGTIRKDVVSTMPRNNRDFVYPSVSLGFVFTELDALKGKSGLSFGKIRASYAEVGQAGSYFNDYYATPSYSGGFWSGNPVQYPLNGAMAYVPYSVIYDPGLKPQNTKSWELGGDFKFLDNRVGIDYTFSRQDVKDQIFSVPLAGSTGASSLVTNGGKIHTVAHEITAFAVPIRTTDFEWSLNVNFSKVDSRVDELKEGVTNINLGGFVTPQIRAGVGDLFPIIYGESFARDENNNIIVDDKGLPVAGITKSLGTVAPKFILGGSTNFTYKNWNLNATIEWKNGGNIYSGSNMGMKLYGTAASTGNREESFVFDGVKKSADGTYVKNDIAITGQTRQSFENRLSNITESNVYDASFVKLRDISLGYKLENIWKDKIDVRVSAFARNLLLWSKMPNLDPEASQGNTNMSGGFEHYSIPQAKSFGFSVNVVF
ncbi:SusC/RagA family TonB-linked outer membrane protein [Myroides odoratimimus]|uniref:SusC/RagA family TonB-linked outer membrane protein n=1 Tax=Myroides odoratimimus TaxID=76832 RepID=UPI0025748FD7|nr:SusC/RagA family TonB-linked outer membrane protein [Myroides odoratimimus]MDM1493973.1 SusC/RagA family TonB-linked outer membrane protein [Myroides odoratimimus]MDM1511440.1 SusC/RagA family TonB-linked outer membrane protein [Myroides odoratimimus]